MKKQSKKKKKKLNTLPKFTKLVTDKSEAEIHLLPVFYYHAATLSLSNLLNIVDII